MLAVAPARYETTPSRRPVSVTNIGPPACKPFKIDNQAIFCTILLFQWRASETNVLQETPYTLSGYGQYQFDSFGSCQCQNVGTGHDSRARRFHLALDILDDLELV